MNREIEFRGYNPNNGKWLYGYYLVNRGKHYIVPDGIQPPSATPEDFEAEPESIGQYTGLQDRNGKKIYEGDIIGGSNGSINGYEWPFKLQIEWDKEACSFHTPKWRDMDKTHYYDVVGNIHDNPELAKTEEQ